jgi:hypothetical protein
MSCHEPKKQARTEAPSLSDPLFAIAQSRCKSLCISGTDSKDVIDLRGRHGVMQALANNKWLHSVDFSHCQLDEQGVAVLMQSNSIDTILHMGRANELTQKMCESLASNPHLTSLLVSAPIRPLRTCARSKSNPLVTSHSCACFHSRLGQGVALHAQTWSTAMLGQSTDSSSACSSVIEVPLRSHASTFTIHSPPNAPSSSLDTAQIYACWPSAAAPIILRSCLSAPSLILTRFTWLRSLRSPRMLYARVYHACPLSRVLCS